MGDGSPTIGGIVVVEVVVDVVVACTVVVGADVTGGSVVRGAVVVVSSVPPPHAAATTAKTSATTRGRVSFTARSVGAGEDNAARFGEMLGPGCRGLRGCVGSGWVLCGAGSRVAGVKFHVASSVP